MYKIAVLSIIFLFVCWLLYNINVLEGFQTSSQTDNTVSSKNECDIVVGSYKTLEFQHKKAVEQDNKPLVESSLSLMNSMKDIIKGMGCNI